jgi:GT2 family glycosyltransferase/glycosyltransferase involved in cell wall biosynthesis
MSAIRASVVIPIYGQAGLLRDCIASLEAAGTEGVELVLVDNASPDDAWRVLDEMEDRATLVRHAENLGFARACNSGAEAATAEVVVFLNTDTVVHPGWLEPLLAAAADPAVGAAGARLLYPDGRVQHAGMALMPGIDPVHIHRHAPGDHPAALRTRDLRMVTAACMAVRRDLFLEMGGFDPAYRNGYEDCDLCMRLWARGLVQRYCADSVVTHLEGRSAGRKDRELDNAVLFRERWGRAEPDWAAVVAEDGVQGTPLADVLWSGPLFDGTPEAALGLAALEDLSAEGLRPMVLEAGGGPCAPGAAEACTPAVLAALNRHRLGVADPVVFHHEVGAPPEERLAIDPSWTAVAVLGPGRREGAAVPGRAIGLVLAGDAVAPAGQRALVARVDAARPRLVAALGDMGVDPERRPGVSWFGPVLGRSGYARAGRGMLQGADDAGVPMRVQPLDRPTPAETPRVTSWDVSDPSLAVVHSLPSGVDGEPVWSTIAGKLGREVVGATCFESTGLPPAWVEQTTWVREVWVPSGFNRRTFAAAGVDPEILHVVPYPVDTRLFSPGPAGAGGEGPFTFLSVFEWTWRKGWDLLLDAYTAEFGRDEPVRLLLVTYRGPGAGGTGTVMEQAAAHLAALGRDPEGVAEIEVQLDPVTTPHLVDLYRTSGAFVLPTRGEGAGMPILEAAACGLPVVATGWGGHEDLMDPAMAYPVEVDAYLPAPPALLRDNPLYEGQSLAEPSAASLRAQMRACYEDGLGARRRAARAREQVERLFSIGAAGRAIDRRVTALIGGAGTTRRHRRAA